MQQMTAEPVAADQEEAVEAGMAALDQATRKQRGGY